MTAEQFIDNYKDGTGRVRRLSGELVKKLMIEFAQYHVEEALKAACKNAYFTTEGGTVLKFSEGFGDLNNESILNAYPLENIK